MCKNNNFQKSLYFNIEMAFFSVFWYKKSLDHVGVKQGNDLVVLLGTLSMEV